MPDTPLPDTPLHPATRDEITQSLAFALRYHGRRRVQDSDDVMARIAVDRLVQHLEQSGFVVMKRPAGKAPSMPQRNHRLQ